MTNSWTAKDTTTHQDHVIAHVVGASVLGYFVFDEVLYLVLDIGFVWTIFLDGEMTLLPHPVAITELDIDQSAKTQIKADIDLLLSDNPAAEKLLRINPSPVQYPINNVSFFADGEKRRFIVASDGANLAIETSLATAEILVYER